MTYLPGRWFHLYLILDLYSRKIVGAEVHASSTSAVSSPAAQPGALVGRHAQLVLNILSRKLRESGDNYLDARRAPRRRPALWGFAGPTISAQRQIADSLDSSRPSATWFLGATM